jgi:uncharacterized membrane protein YhhN
MKQLFKTSGFYLFWVIAFINIIAALLDNVDLQTISKPLLIPILIATLVCSTTLENNRFLLIIGLFFSFLGDVALMLERQNSSFFIIGLLAFLLTHLFYIAFFFKIKASNSSLLKDKPYLVLLIILYTAGLLYLLIPKLGALVIPVIVYAVILTTMFIASLYAYNNITKPANILFGIGAAFFVASDTLLAINKFYSPIPASGLLIMLTYCLAQFFIVKGFIKKQQ